MYYKLKYKIDMVLQLFLVFAAVLRGGSIGGLGFLSQAGYL